MDEKYLYERCIVKTVMAIIDKLFGEHTGLYRSPSEDELQMEQEGTKEKKPKAEISEDQTVMFTEHDRLWEGMK